MSASPDDKRLQDLFRRIDGGLTPNEVMDAISAINRHLAPSGLRLRDLVVAHETSAEAERRAQLAKSAEVHSLVEYTQRNLRRTAIQRDVLATFLSDRALEVARLQALKIIERVEKGEDVDKSFGCPGWSGKTGHRPKTRWGY